MTFQTNKKTPDNRGAESLKALFELLCPIWLTVADDLRTSSMNLDKRQIHLIKEILA